MSPIQLKAFCYSIPLTTRFRGIDVRDGILLRGPAGWAEFSPFWDYDASESRAWWLAAIDAARFPMPDAVRARIPVNVTVPAVGPERAREIVSRSGGCGTAKVKVAQAGQSLSDDVARVAAVRDIMGPGGRIRIDANAAWTREDAVAAIRAIDRAAGRLEYVEQPCASVSDLAWVRRQVDVPIAADESIRRAEDPFEVVRADAADLVVLKVQPLGGVRVTLDLAERIGLPVVVSSAIETSVGLAMGVALAAALPELPYACGLATAQLLTGDVVDSPLLPDDGAIEVRAISPRVELLREHAASDELAGRWRERLGAVMALGADGVEVDWG